MISRRLTWIAALLTSCVCTISAEELETTETTDTSQKATIELPAWVKNIKFSGYGMLQYQGQDPEGNHSNTFNLRLARFILDGKIGDFDWRAQIQGTNVKGPGEPTVQLVDLYAEWRRFPEFKVRAGQFKRAFTYENPTHPITQGWRAYADVINNLSGFGDRTGEKSSGGRDIGIQFSGDLFPNAKGRRLFHYQVGVYNGEGINEKDKDNRKDIIGGVWVMPIKGLRIGAFGVGVLPRLLITFVRLITARETRPMVGMPLVSCLSSSQSCMPRPVTSAIAAPRSGAVPRHRTKSV